MDGCRHAGRHGCTGRTHTEPREGRRDGEGVVYVGRGRVHSYCGERVSKRGGLGGHNGEVGERLNFFLGGVVEGRYRGVPRVKGC